MGKQSKRQGRERAREREAARIRGKDGGASGLDLLLSDELREQLQANGGDGQALVLPATKTKPAAGKEDKSGGDTPARPLSKSEVRKLKQVQMKKERRENLGQVLATLQSSSISEDKLALMRPLHQRGAKETKKQRLKRALRLERAGLVPDAEAAAELYRPRVVKAQGEESDEEDAADGSDEEELKPGMSGPSLASTAQHTPVSPATTTQQQQVQEPPAAADQSDGQSDSCEEGEGGGEEGQQQEHGDEEQAATADAQAAAEARRAELLAQIRKAKQEAGIQGPQDEDEEEVALVAEARARAARAAQEAAHIAADAEAAAAAAGATAGVQGKGKGKAGKGSSQRGAGLARPRPRHRVVHLTRPPEIEEARQGLPIIGMEQEIIESIMADDVVVLCGETGCGKTTQVPQFLLEAGFGCSEFPERAGRIGVTQPRRVAATSTAERVASELGERLGQTVGYQVRYDHAVGAGTRLKFMTDGILMRELQDDFLLTRYSALLVDEAHERSLNTDLLLGMLSRIVPMRRKLWAQQRAQPGYDPAAPGAVHPLKLIIMSATLRTEDFVANTRLFPKPPPLIQVPARQYPVTVHFSRRTEMGDYVGAAFRKVCRIHRELPPGGVLVFLTGQREVEHLCTRLRRHFAKKTRTALQQEGEQGQQVPAGESGQPEQQEDTALREAGTNGGDGAGGGGGVEDTFGPDRAEAAVTENEGNRLLDAEQEEVGDDYDDMNRSEDEDEEEVVVMGGESLTPQEVAEAEARFEQQLQQSIQGGSGLPGGTQAAGDAEGGPTPVHVLPLYAMLPASAQARVFRPPPPGCRLIVVATNVAETSLTIPGIRYVVDAGRSKQRLLEGDAGGGSGLARFEVRWVSQAAAAQRAGRAGRTGPGHCYRLFSSAHYNDTMPRHSPPEIVNTALEGVVLVLKAMGVDKVHNFPFPTPPEAHALRAAHSVLEALCALEPGSGALTHVGRAMAVFPIGPRHSRMLLEVAAWQLRQAGAAAAAELAAAAGTSPPSSSTASQALPFAIALAAVLTVEEPFMHLDASSVGGAAGGQAGKDGEGQQQQQAEEDGEGEDEGEEGGLKRRRRESGSSAGQGPGSDAAAKAAEAAQLQKLNRMRAAQGRLKGKCGEGDALAALAALCAYEASGESEEFCSEHALHHRPLKEAADLHRQLLRVFAALAAQHQQEAQGHPAKGSGATGLPLVKGGPLAVSLCSVAASDQGQALLEAVQQLDTAGSRGRLPTLVSDCLKRAMAVGWADQVARRVRSAEALARLRAKAEGAHGGGKRHAVRYMSAAMANAHGQGPESLAAAAATRRAEAAGLDEDVSGDVYLHPRSSIHAAAPEYVVYLQVVRTAKRPYMMGPTPVQPEWLAASGTPLAVFSAPLPDPGPTYRPHPVDAVLAWHEVTYGRHEWPLPRCLRPHPDPKTKAAVFGAALLEGRVVPGFAELRPLLLSAPAMVSRPEMQGVARVGELVSALTSSKVWSLGSLARVWSSQPSFLEREVSLWVAAANQRKLAQAWPGIVQGALQAWNQATASAAATAERDARESGKSKKRCAADGSGAQKGQVNGSVAGKSGGGGVVKRRKQTVG